MSKSQPPRQGRAERERRQVPLPPQLERVNLHAAGIDVGMAEHFVAVPPGSAACGRDVRRFDSFTGDLHELAQWLQRCGVTTVAMESTGVYWIPLYELLVEYRFEVKLVDAHRLKNVRGRKSDVLDCQWLQELHTFGLLAGAFRPEDQICVLRSYCRQRATLVSCAAQHIQHMQKALEQMNIKLAEVLSNITGVTAMRIIKAILEGERDPIKLAAMRDYRCKSDELTIARALNGNYREEHLFALRQSLALFEFYQTQIESCDQEIEKCLARFEPKATESLPRKRKNSSNPLSFDARSLLHRLCGVDLTRIDGIDENLALRLLAEIGTDMSAWPTEKHFASWTGLAPGTRISGGKPIGGRHRRRTGRVAYLLRLAANALHRNKSALGANYRRLRARLGSPVAITALARKIGCLIYRLLKFGEDYVDQGEAYYEERYRKRAVDNLKRRAREFGFELTRPAPVPA